MLIYFHCVTGSYLNVDYFARSFGFFGVRVPPDFVDGDHGFFVVAWSLSLKSAVYSLILSMVGHSSLNSRYLQYSLAAIVVNHFVATCQVFEVTDEQLFELFVHTSISHNLLVRGRWVHNLLNLLLLAVLQMLV